MDVRVNGTSMRDVYVNGVSMNVVKVNGRIVFHKSNFLNITYSGGRINNAWLDYDRDPIGVTISVFGASHSTHSHGGDAFTFYTEPSHECWGRSVINSSWTNSEIYNALNGQRVGSGITLITRVGEVLSPVCKCWGYVKNGGGSSGWVYSQIESTFQDCAPTYSGTNWCKSHIHNKFMSWCYSLSGKLFNQEIDSGEIWGNDAWSTTRNGVYDNGRIIYASNTGDSGRIRVNLDSSERYKVTIWAQCGNHASCYAGSGHTNISRI